ncbi:MAG: type II toxin-antitoxin system VapC family toxin [Myxococcaceae bacterium]
MTARKILLDTGVIVAALNDRDPDHVRVVDWLRPTRAQWFTSEGVLVEATHLLRKVRQPVQRVVQFAAALRCDLVAVTPARLARAVELVEEHPHLRLDLVDALLGAASEELRIDELASLDRRDSLSLRRRGRPSFTVWPAP